MLKIEITLPASFAVASRDREVKVDLAKLPADIFAKAALHGIKQKLADAAAGAAKASFRDKAEGESADAWAKAFAAFKDDSANEAAIADKGLALMEKALAKLLEGDWAAERGASAGLSKLDVEAAKAFIAGAKLEFPKGTSTADRYASALEQLKTRPEATQLAVYKYAEKVLAAILDVPAF